jgi:hypothetical protein
VVTLKGFSRATSLQVAPEISREVPGVLRASVCHCGVGRSTMS